MMLCWVNGTAIASGTAYAIPASAGLPATDTLVGIRTVTILPLANGTAASVTAPIQETGLASGTAAAGDVTIDVTSQKLTSGDDIPADAVVLANVILAGDQPVSS